MAEQDGDDSEVAAQTPARRAAPLWLRAGRARPSRHPTPGAHPAPLCDVLCGMT